MAIPVPVLVRAYHEAGHVVVARAHGFRVYRVSIEMLDNNRYGYTLTGKPEATAAAIESACAGLSPVERFRACQLYAEVAVGGKAGELVGQRLLGSRAVAPMPCTDERVAQAYLQLGTSRGNLRSDAVGRHLRAAIRTIDANLRSWHAVVQGLQQKSCLDEGEIGALLGT